MTVKCVDLLHITGELFIVMFFSAAEAPYDIFSHFVLVSRETTRLNPLFPTVSAKLFS